MEGADILLLIAEISVAFAGFAGIVTVIGRRAEGDWSEADCSRFWQMIEVSMLALLFSVLPFGFYYGKCPDACTWGTCSLLLAIAGGVQMTRSARHTLKALRSDQSVSVSFTVTYVATGAAVLVVQVMNVIGVVFQHTLGAYLLGVLWQLFLACVLFWRLLRFSDLPYGKNCKG